MWHDVHQGVLCLYKDLFYHLESIGLLDPNNDLDLFYLHYVFIPRIDACLKEWKNAWVKHPLRTEGNLSPEGTVGLQSLATSTSNLASELFENYINVRTSIIIFECSG